SREIPCTCDSTLARQPAPATAIVSKTSCRSGGSDSLRSALASCTLRDIAMQVVPAGGGVALPRLHRAVGRLVRRGALQPLAGGVVGREPALGKEGLEQLDHVER